MAHGDPLPGTRAPWSCGVSRFGKLAPSPPLPRPLPRPLLCFWRPEAFAGPLPPVPTALRCSSKAFLLNLRSPAEFASRSLLQLPVSSFGVLTLDLKFRRRHWVIWEEPVVHLRLPCPPPCPFPPSRPLPQHPPSQRGGRSVPRSSGTPRVGPPLSGSASSATVLFTPWCFPPLASCRQHICSVSHSGQSVLGAGALLRSRWTGRSDRLTRRTLAGQGRSVCLHLGGRPVAPVAVFRVFRIFRVFRDGVSAPGSQSTRRARGLGVGPGSATNWLCDLGGLNSPCPSLHVCDTETARAAAS